MKIPSSEIHPELQPFARLSPKFSFSQKNLWFMNLLMHLMPAPKPAKDIRIENLFIPGPGERTRIRLRIYAPKPAAGAAPVLLWLHGGGYVMGRPEMDDRVCAEYVRQAGIAVVSVDYRLAPKHPFPAALDDCTAALAWVVSQAGHLGIDATRIAIGGESAGGGLAAALVQRTYDRREITPVFQLLVYPMLDDRTVLRTDLDDSQGVLWDQQSNRFGWQSYLRKDCGAEEAPVYAVPARRDDLSGLPPAWIGVGSLDIFHDEAVAYAQRLKAAGVAGELKLVPGAFHGFDVINPRLPIVQDFRQSQISALKNAFHLAEEDNT